MKLTAYLAGVLTGLVGVSATIWVWVMLAVNGSALPIPVRTMGFIGCDGDGLLIANIDFSQLRVKPGEIFLDMHAADCGPDQ